MHDVVVGHKPAGLPMPTGVGALDVALGGGIPRGRITEVVGIRGAGKTALLRRVVQRVLASGAWVAWIDARRTLAPQPWADLGSRLVMIRPRDATRSAWSADLLLRSGVFALVVLDGAPLLSRVNGVRLAQLARERDAALVVVTDGTQPSRLGGTTRLRITRHTVAPAQSPRRRPPLTPTPRSGALADPEPAATALTAIPRATPAASGPPPGFSVTVEKGGVLRSVEVSCAVVVARRMCADPEIPDRRGVARGTRHTWTPHGHASIDPHTAHPITWGGLGASVDDVRSANQPVSHPAGPPLSGPANSTTDPARDLDRRTRDWSSSKGRRRVAESSYGRRSRREIAREQTGVSITTQSGQSQGSNGTARVGRDGGRGTLGGGAAHVVAGVGGGSGGGQRGLLHGRALVPVGG
jgi:recombination protein RecA